MDDPSIEKDVELNFQLNIYINTLYIDICGILDNCVWCLKEHKKIECKKHMYVSLFHPKFIEITFLKNLSLRLTPFLEWRKDLKKRGDPVAHRIPLYIPQIFRKKTDPLPLFITYFEESDERWNL